MSSAVHGCSACSMMDARIVSQQMPQLMLNPWEVRGFRRLFSLWEQLNLPHQNGVEAR